MTETLLLTRPSRQTEPLKTQLENTGLTVFVQPVIEIIPPASWDETDSVLAALDTFDYIVFTSRNAVEFFFERFDTRFADRKPSLSNTRFAAVGSGTADKLREHIGTVSSNIIFPENFSAESLADILKTMKIQGKHFLFPCGNKRSGTLPEELRNNGGIVAEAAVYQSIDAESVKPEIADMMSKGQFDWTTAMSPATAKSLVRLFGNDLHKTKIVSISPAVSQTLRQLGFISALEAEQSSAEGIIAALAAVLLSGH